MSDNKNDDLKCADVKQELSNWYLKAVSVQAKKRNRIQLKIGNNKVGKSSQLNSIVLPSLLCSKSHCDLVVGDEVILRDNSLNGTFVNCVQYKNSRQILCVDDQIGFGGHGKQNPDVFLYKLKYVDLNNADEICLEENSDDDCKDIKNIDTSICLNPKIPDIIEIEDSDDDAVCYRSLDDSLHKDNDDTLQDVQCRDNDNDNDNENDNDNDNENENENDMEELIQNDHLGYVSSDEDLLSITESNHVQVYSVTPEPIQMGPPASPDPEVHYQVPEPDLSSDYMHIQIKQEISVMSMELDRSMIKEYGEEVIPVNDGFIETIDLLSDSDDNPVSNQSFQNECQNPEPTLNVNKNTAEDMFQQAKKRQKMSSKMGDGNQSTASNDCTQSSTEKSSPVNSPHPPSSTDTVAASSGILRAVSKLKVKYSDKSRGFLLAEDMLASARAKSSGTAQSNETDKVKSRLKVEILTETSVPLQTSSNFLLKEVSPFVEIQVKNSVSFEWSALNIICEISRWDIKWLQNEELSPNIFDHSLLRHMTEDFITADEYQCTLLPLMKQELWHNILTKFNQKSRRKPLFSELLSYNLKQRDGGLSRFVVKCRASLKNIEESEYIRMGDIAVITHSRGRFFAYIYKAITDKKSSFSKFEFEMAASVISKEKLEVKHVSVERIMDIKSFLSQFSNFAKLKSNVLLDNIIWPDVNQLVDISEETFTYKGSFAFDDQQHAVFKSVALQTQHTMKNPTRSLIQLIDGPAGTGKSTLIVHLIIHLLSETYASRRNVRIFLGSVNDGSVDKLALNLAEIISKMCADEKPSLVRLGQLMKSSNVILQNLTIDSKKIKPSQLERLEKANIICSTLKNSTELYKVFKKRIDVCILDDASIFAETSLFALFRLGFNSMILVGDSQIEVQSIKSSLVRNYGLKMSLFNRMLNHGRISQSPIAAYHLLNQHRMHPDICIWPNNQFYNNVMICNKISIPCIFHPYTVFNFLHRNEENEIDCVAKLISALIATLKPTKYSCGIITPYQRTQEMLTKHVWPEDSSISIDVCDSHYFRGDEKDIILLMMPLQKSFAELKVKNSLLVALTRAKCCFIICGNFDLDNGSFWNNIIENASERGRFFGITIKDDFMDKLLMK